MLEEDFQGTKNKFYRPISHLIHMSSASSSSSRWQCDLYQHRLCVWRQKRSLQGNGCPNTPERLWKEQAWRGEGDAGRRKRSAKSGMRLASLVPFSGIMSTTIQQNPSFKNVLKTEQKYGMCSLLPCGTNTCHYALTWCFIKKTFCCFAVHSFFFSFSLIWYRYTRQNGRQYVTTWHLAVCALLTGVTLKGLTLQNFVVFVYTVYVLFYVCAGIGFCELTWERVYIWEEF